MGRRKEDDALCGTLAVSILSNYYISIMVCIYLVLYFVILILEQKSGIGKAILKFATGSILAGGMGAILILPEIVALSGSGSGGISFPEKWSGILACWMKQQGSALVSSRLLR
ncbi:hypothetical protein DW059_05410 [Roseburia sp. AF42-8]|nr:hypothetical protein DW059_05410 [Roseburia sp. AF42-8]